MVTLTYATTFFIAPVRHAHPTISVLSVITSTLNFNYLITNIDLVDSVNFSITMINLLIVNMIILTLCTCHRLRVTSPLLSLHTLNVTTFHAPTVVIDYSFTYALTFVCLIPRRLRHKLNVDSALINLLVLPNNVIGTIYALVTNHLFSHRNTEILI